jgi:hypothetical protein
MPMSGLSLSDRPGRPRPRRTFAARIGQVPVGVLSCRYHAATKLNDMSAARPVLGCPRIADVVRLTDKRSATESACEAAFGFQGA